MIPLVAGIAVAAAAAGLFTYNRATARKAEAAVPPDGRFLEIDGNRIHYVDRGSGPPVVMVHGLGGQMRNFARPLVDDLARDHRVILVDRPGSGHSRRAAGCTSSLWQQAATIAGLIRTLDLGPVTLVGHSLGGAIALALATDHPDCVASLALIAPLTQDQTDIPDPFKGLEIRSPLVRRIVAETIAVPIAVATSEKAMRIVFGPEPVPEDFAVQGGAVLAARPCAFYETSCDLVALEHQLAELVSRYPTLRVPVSILYGAGDQLLPPALHGEATAEQIAGARLEIVPGGHMLPFTQPELTARWLREAMAAAESARSQTEPADAAA